MKIKIKRKLKELSGVGAVGGHVDQAAPKKDELDEMFSSSTQTGGVRKIRISGEKEFAGMRTRGLQMGLQNFKEQIEDTLDLNDPDATAQLDRAIDDDTEPPERPTQAQLDYKELYEIVLERGYRLGSTLGSGQYGMVFSAEDISTGGDYVVKVVGYGESRTPISQEVIDRELRNYNTVTQAASTDERMWRHFPETYDSWKGSVSGLDVGLSQMSIT